MRLRIWVRAPSREQRSATQCVTLRRRALRDTLLRMSKRFNMVLSDEDYARMEGLRSRLGLRSWAEVVRAMLASAELDADLRATAAKALQERLVIAEEPLPTPQTEPQPAKPKARPVKSRLKGEWKAP